MERAYGYLRVSSQGQLDGTGLSRQGDKITKFCDGRYDLQGCFIEWGVSGTLTTANRPALAECIERCRQENGPKVIIVENVDRWSRDAIVGVLLFRDCEAAGIKVIAADSGLELTVNDNPTSKFIQQILSGVAELQKDMLVARMRIAREMKKKATGGKEGKEGVKPYGELVEEAPYRSVVERLAAESSSSADFVGRLVRHGVPTRSGKPWSRSSAYKLRKRVLQNS